MTILSPYDNNYLTSAMLAQSLQEGIPLQLNTSAIEAVVDNAPVVRTAGYGVAYLQGAFKIKASSLSTETIVATLPNNFIVLNDSLYKVSFVSSGGNVYAENYLKISSSPGVIDNVQISDGGTYTNIPTITASGNGSGAVLSAVMGAKNITVATPQSGNGNYLPGDNILATGGVSLDVLSTQVSSATITAGGIGGINGTQTVTGTTGSGPTFTASVIVSGGSISSIVSITSGGNYTYNPLDLINEPVSGAGLIGAKLNVKMGIKNFRVLSGGGFSSLPTNPITQTSTSGKGTGATFNITNYYLKSVNVTNPGLGYDKSTVITVSGSGGAVAYTIIDTNKPAALKILNQTSLGQTYYLNSVIVILKLIKV